ncbi:MAG: META domain-containing protein [Vicinamibacterales bacterium]
MVRRMLYGTACVAAGCTANGVDSPNATPTATADAVLVALGHEPGWRLDIGGGQLVLLADYGEVKLSMPAPAAEVLPNGRRYSGQAEGRTVTATVIDRICEDGATGMPRPYTVTLTLDGRSMNGCGGDTSTLLEGAWIVTAVDGQPLVDGTTPTIAFEAGRVTGNTACNSFTGSYTLSPERLTIGPLATTRRACPGSIMAQESSLLAVLGAVDRFEASDDGTITLFAPDRTLTARRE